MNTEPKFISLLSDYGFKTVFADESDTKFLRKSLQALLQSDVPIEKVEFLRTDFIGLTKGARGGVYDLICQDEKSRTFIVEMQLGHYKYFIQRAKFYAFQKFNTMVEKGKYRFDNLTPIYCIGFLAEPIFHKSNEYYHFGRLKNQKGEEMDNQISHVIVEVAKFEKTEHELETDLDKLIYLMKNVEQIQGLDQLPQKLSDDWIEQAIEKLDKRKMTPEQRMNYEIMMARNASIVEILKDQERKQIAAEAEKRGEKRAELKKAKATAKKLKELGVDIDIISASTGLSLTEIEKL